MAIFCTKCGKEVDTLSKRRHRCRKQSDSNLPDSRQVTIVDRPYWSSERCEKALEVLKSYSKSEKD